MKQLIFAAAAVMAAGLWADTCNDALDNDDLLFTRYGNISWSLSTTYKKVGASSLQSGLIDHSQTNGFYTEVAGPGTVTWYWSASTEYAKDCGCFYVDNYSGWFERITGIFTNSLGQLEWREKAHEVKTSGRHRLRWEYSKDSSGSKGLDRVFVDCVKWKPANDDFASARAISGVGGTDLGSTVGSGFEAGEPIHDDSVQATNSIWWVWTAPAAGEVIFDTKGSVGRDGTSVLDTVMGIYTGSSLSSLTRVTSHDDVNRTDMTSLCKFTAQSGKKYYIAVATYKSSSKTPGTVCLNWRQKPKNDNFENHTLIQSASGTVTGSTRYATSQTGEPRHNNYASSTNSVWWMWVAPRDGMATFSTTNSTFDTVMAVYKANGPATLANLVGVASNDDQSSGCETSRCRFRATSGESYFIAVAGYGGASGDISLSWETGPANDDFAYSTSIAGEYGQARGTTIGATAEPGEPLPNFVKAATNTVWWTWEAPGNGTAVFHTTNGTLDTVMGVYTGTDVNNLAKKVQNDDYNDSDQSYCLFWVTAGEAYHIAVSGYGNEQGEVDLRWTFWPKTYCLAVNPNGGIVNGSDIYYEYGEVLRDGFADYSSIPVPLRDGYIFTGWYSAASGGTKVYGADGKCITGTAYWDSDKHYIYAKDLTVFAQWEKDPEIWYTLTRHPNGGVYETSPGATVAENGLRINTSAYCDIGVPTRDGHTFIGWFTEPVGGTKVYDINGKCIAGTYWNASEQYIYHGDLYVVAHWVRHWSKYTLTRIPNGGTYQGKTTGTVAENGLETGTGNYWSIGMADRPDYAFDGWWTEPSGGVQVYGVDGNCVVGDYWTAGKAYIHDGNLIVYAHWRALSGKKYTLTRNPNGGTYQGKTTATVTANGLQTGTGNFWSIGVSDRAGYAFDGWWTAADGGVKVYGADGNCIFGEYWSTGKAYTYEGNLTVYAHWRTLSGKKYTLTRDPNGGKYQNKTTAIVTAGGLQTGTGNYWTIGMADRQGYAFDGWWTAASGGVKVYGVDGNCVFGEYWSTGKAYTHEGDLTVYAHWRALSGKKYTLTRDPNGGTYQGKTAATVTANGLQTGTGNFWTIGVPTRGGYTFDGWWTAASGGVKVYGADGNCIFGEYWSLGKAYTYEGNLTVYARWTKASAMVVSGCCIDDAEEASGWAVGEFDGVAVGADGVAAGVVALTVTADGEVWGKVLKDGLVRTIAADEVTLAVDESAPFRRAVATGDGWVAWQNLWKTETWKSAAESFAEAPVLVTPDGVALKFSSTGAVTATYGAYSCSSVLIPTASTPHFSLFVYFPPKAGEFEGYAAEVPLVWDGAAFSLGK